MSCYVSMNEIKWWWWWRGKEIKAN